MNCKPGQMATIVRASIVDHCVAKRQGCPVRVVKLAQPTGPFSALQWIVEGPIWEIESPLSCPSAEPCHGGVWAIPDACLRPFDEGSEPAADDKPVEIERPSGVEVLTIERQL